MTPHEYYCMTPKEVILMTRGYLLKRSKEWEQTRTVAYNVYLNRRIRGNHMKPQEWMPLPTDKFQRQMKSTEEMRLRWEKFKDKK